MASSVDVSNLKDEEGYIYMGEDGVLQSKLELTVVWSLSRDKRILVTVDKTESFEFLQIKVAELMEQYSIFEGLTNLRVSYLIKKDTKALLPDTGEIGTYLRSGEKLLCDLSSSDLWLELDIICKPLQKNIKFGVKLMKSITYQTFKETMHNYVISLLSSKDFKFQDLNSYLEFRKIRSVFKNRTDLSLSSSSMFESTVTYFSNEPDEFIPIGDIFNQIKRSISYVLILDQKFYPHPSLLQGNGSLSEGASEGFTEYIGFETVRFNIGFGGYGMLPIRDLAFLDLDTQSFKMNSSQNDSRLENRDPMVQNTCCRKLGCILL